MDKKSLSDELTADDVRKAKNANGDSLADNISINFSDMHFQIMDNGKVVEEIDVLPYIQLNLVQSVRFVQKKSVFLHTRKQTM